jgi:hypothetical protein
MDGVVVFPFEIKRLSCRTVGDVSGIFQKKGLARIFRETGIA